MQYNLVAAACIESVKSHTFSSKDILPDALFISQMSAIFQRQGHIISYYWMSLFFSSKESVVLILEYVIPLA